MKLQVFSDLHVEHGGGGVPPANVDADCVVIAGDVHVPLRSGLVEIRRVIPQAVPCVVVAGNHEFYRTCLPIELAAAREVAAELGIHLLENDTVVVRGVRFVGASLWTDYDLFGVHARPHAMDTARSHMNDHRRITWRKAPWSRFAPQHARRLHAESRRYIGHVLSEPFSGPTCVVTHHAPHRDSIHPKLGEAMISAAYASDLSALIEAGEPDLWVHGHTHWPVDYRLGRTRILSNPRGYPGEVPTFDAAFTVDMQATTGCASEADSRQPARLGGDDAVLPEDRQ